uniref:Uncharacterized protein n=1 Tax=Corethron hystrix TaxID=216773 RepID=A0A7S1BBY8_9STRA|mmetsp:Transcript_20391/g.46269  ORF Transcript_20391/g.46269 Transcript_20391/m.46269 type:complete len:132 (+) Transcript_20391:142-537(+)
MIAIPFSIAIVSKIIADKPAAVGCFLILLLSRNSSVHSREYSFETERHGGSLQETNFSLASDLTDNSKFKSYDILHKDDEIENDSISSLLMNYRNETVSRSDKLVFLEKTYREKSKERSLQVRTWWRFISI